MPEKNDWILGNDVADDGEQIAAAQPASLIMTPAKTSPKPDVHTDPTIPSFVKPSGTMAQNPVFPPPKTPYILSDAEKAPFDAMAKVPLEKHPSGLALLCRARDARNPNKRLLTPKEFAEYHYCRTLIAKLSDTRRLPTDAELQQSRSEGSISRRLARKDRSDKTAALYAALEKNELPTHSVLDPVLWKETIEFLEQSSEQAEILQDQRLNAEYAVQWLPAFVYHSPSACLREHLEIESLLPTDGEMEQNFAEHELIKSPTFILRAKHRAIALISFHADNIRPRSIARLERCLLFLNERKLKQIADAALLLESQGGDPALAETFTKRIDFQIKAVEHRVTAIRQPKDSIKEPNHVPTVPGIESVLHNFFGVPLLSAALDAEAQPQQATA